MCVCMYVSVCECQCMWGIGVCVFVGGGRVPAYLDDVLEQV